MNQQQSRPFCIGVIGGMGPRATVRFELKLLEKLGGSDQALPDILCSNIGRIPDRTAYLCGQGATPAPMILSSALSLERMGATVLCMPCNTAHAQPILTDVLPSLTAPLLNMPQLTLAKMQSLELSRALVLATDGTQLAKIYESEYTINPTEPVQTCVMQVIQSIKVGEAPSSSQLNRVKQAIRQQNADSVILACTELSKIASQLEGIVVVDTLDVLADACVQYYERSKLWQTNQKVLVPINTR